MARPRATIHNAHNREDRLVVHDSKETLWKLAANDMIHSSDLSESLRIDVGPSRRSELDGARQLPYQRQAPPNVLRSAICYDFKENRNPSGQSVSVKELQVQIKVLRQALLEQDRDLTNARTQIQSQRKESKALGKICAQLCQLHVNKID